MTQRTPLRVAAVDLGATSGRVMVGHVGRDELRLEEVHRFPNGPVEVDGHLRWDVVAIWREVLTGLRAAAADGAVDSIGIDSWAVDYGLLDDGGQLVEQPFAYRDSRTDGVRERVVETVPEQLLYDTTGIQQLPFNTLYQLAASLPLPEQAATLLMVPDLLGYWLTGAVGAELTNASTTQLLDVRTHTWATGLAERVGIPARVLPPLRRAGDVVGSLLEPVAAETGLPTSTPVVAVGSHDTASAVVGTPLEAGRGAAYISSGTWSLVGVELDEPALSEDARLADFTNEGGVDDTIRFLRNVMGLWVLSEAVRAWERGGADLDLATLLADAAHEPGFGAVVDVDAPELLPPGDMGARIEDLCRRSGQTPPATRAGVVRCILESLALAYRRNVRLVGELTGRPVEVVHIVGGGVRNELLCQLTADACGLPVLAGPVEAAALGNVLVQARTLGADLTDLASMRALVRRTHPVRRYEPSGDAAAWVAAEERLVPARTRA